MSPTPQEKTDQSGDDIIEQSDIVEQIVTIPNAKRSNTDNPTPVTSMTAMISHLNQNQNASTGSATTRPTQPVRNVPRQPPYKVYPTQRRGNPQSGRFDRTPTVQNPTASHPRDQFPYPIHRSAFTFNHPRSHFTDHISAYEHSEMLEDAYDQSRGAFFSKPSTVVPKFSSNMPDSNPTSDQQPEAHSGHVPSINLTAATKRVPTLVERNTIQSMHGTILEPNVQDNMEDVEEAREAARPYSRTRTASMPARVESDTFSAVPRPLDLGRRTKGGLLTEQISALERRVEEVQEGVLARLDRVEKKVDRTLLAVEKGGVARGGGGGGGGGGGRGKGVMEEWYEEAKRK